jgi:ketosteroid isomerase-like protein
LDSSRPGLVSKLLEAFLNEGDIDGLLGLYENDAVFADFAGAAKGLADIRSAHQRFLDSGLTLTLNDSVVFEADGIALVHWSWTVDRSDGSSTEGVSAEVLRRQADGSWKFIIDNSDGSALVGLL